MTSALASCIIAALFIILFPYLHPVGLFGVWHWNLTLVPAAPHRCAKVFPWVLSGHMHMVYDGAL